MDCDFINFYYQSVIEEDRNEVYKDIIQYHNSAQEDIHIPEGHIKGSESWALNVKPSKTGEELLKLFSISSLLC